LAGVLQSQMKIERRLIRRRQLDGMVGGASSPW
jgi:hypothetical protein